LDTHKHLEESLQRGIDLIRRKVIEMADLSERALKSSLQALIEQNRQLAYSVILRDQYIDELETELDRLCLEFMVRQQPVASHLRFVFAVIKINKGLERVGDYAESIARQILAVTSLQPQPSYGRFIELANLSVHMLHDSVQAFVHQDADLARRTMEIEARADAMRNTINAELAESRMADLLPAAALGPLTGIARRFERVTDQAQNICEEVLYMCTGEFVKHKGAEAFRILLIDERNSCLSQMAEGIGTALGVPRFVFSCAGTAPQPVDKRAVDFMASKGIDISRQSTKSLEQVPYWEYYQVMIALDDAGRRVLPGPHTKTVCLTWHIADPTKVEGSAEVVQAAFESAYQALDAQIRELVQAILGDVKPKNEVHDPQS
jgi:phosphate transport system protein